MTAQLTSVAPPGRSLSAAALGRLARWTQRVPTWLVAATLLTLLGLIYGVVYWTGGTQRAFTHLFYVPIILGALSFRWWGALATATAAAVLCGPLMPLDSTTGEAQEATSWVFRSAMFVLISALARVAFELHEQLAERQFSAEVQQALAHSAGGAQTVDAALIPLVPGVLAEHRFHVVYQPIYSLSDGALLAVEALTRFDAEPRRTPDVWFEAAAAAGLGGELELAAIEAAVAGAAGLPPGIALSVNASPATLGVERLHAVVAAAGRPVVVELTEHAVVEDYHLLQDTVAGMRALGVRIAVDDAGAGISSLRHIVQLAPEVIKLDISLTQNLATSPLRRALAGALIDFARHTEAQLIVEGIEEVGDLSIWTALGAHAVQGYLVGRPGPLPFAAHCSTITGVRGARV